MHDEPTGVYILEPHYLFSYFKYILTSDLFRLIYLDKSWTRKGPGSAYDKWNISAVICNIDIP